MGDMGDDLRATVVRLEADNQRLRAALRALFEAEREGWVADLDEGRWVEQRIMIHDAFDFLDAGPIEDGVLLALRAALSVEGDTQ